MKRKKNKQIQHNNKNNPVVWRKVVSQPAPATFQYNKETLWWKKETYFDHVLTDCKRLTKILLRINLNRPALLHPWLIIIKWQQHNLFCFFQQASSRLIYN
jgi:hypothetical protein